MWWVNVLAPVSGSQRYGFKIRSTQDGGEGQSSDISGSIVFRGRTLATFDLFDLYLGHHHHHLLLRRRSQRQNAPRLRRRSQRLQQCRRRRQVRGLWSGVRTRLEMRPCISVMGSARRKLRFELCTDPSKDALGLRHRSFYYRILPHKRPGAFEIEIKSLPLLLLFCICFPDNVKLFF